jgi:hypothetical protein
MPTTALNRISLCTIVLGLAGGANGAEVLDDEKLDAITAGTAPTAFQRPPVAFEVNRVTARGTRIGATGNARVFDGADLSSIGLLRLEDQAQGNLRALVNTNAVNSAVQVLINLNININSQVNSLNQVNSAAPPR